MEKKQINLTATGKIKSSKDVTVLCASLVISVLALYFVAAPSYGRKISLAKENTAREADLASKRELLANIQNFNKDNENLGGNSKKLAAFIPNRNTYEEFFVHLKELAKNSNLQITSFSSKQGSSTATSTNPAVAETAPADATANSAASSYAETKTFPLNEQGVSFSAKGDFENILNFSKILENGIPFVQESSIEIAYDKENGAVTTTQNGNASAGPVILNATINFKFNYY